MKIAMFSDNFYPEMSGISDSIIATAKGLAEKGHRINFYVPSHPKKNFLVSKFAPKELDLGENIKIFRIPSLPYPPAPTKAGRMALPFLFTYRHIKKFNPDFIHIHHNFGTGVEALMVAKFLKIPVIGTNHTPMSEFMKYGPLKTKWLEKIVLKYVSWLYNKCVWVSSPSESIIKEMRQYGFKKEARRVSNPIDVSNFGPVDNQVKSELKNRFNLSLNTVLYTGRLAEEKKIDDIIRAISIVKEKIPNVSLALTGHGNAEENLKKLVKDLELEKNVTFFGFIDNDTFSKLYKASDIFTVMSTAETQCISMMQAMASGLPVIGANAWGLPEYISTECGYVVEPGDYKMLAEKIIYLFEHPEERKKLSEGGIEHVKKYSRENVVLQWENIYKTELLKIRPKLKLSFVIPAWNEEKYIGQCLESIIGRMKKSECDVEIIAVNNASVDKTREIILRYPEVRLVDEPKKGLPQARQAGFLASSGDLIANMDADSVLPNGWIEKAVSEFAKDPKLVALSGPYIFYDLGGFSNIGVKIFYFLGFVSHLVAHYILRKGAAIQGGNFVLRREALEKIGGFNVDIKFYGEDTDIARRIQEIGKVKFTFGFPMSTSGRRLMKEGIVTMGIKYAINYAWIILFKKPFTREYLYVGDHKIEKK